MKILVLGGTGLLGSRVCEKLKQAGSGVIIGAPSRGIDILTGEGLDVVNIVEYTIYWHRVVQQ
ncbi:MULTISPECIES: NAD-dependent epimerase/dehydratase family protein [Sphingobacterium]|uniref:NAD-dependent epimerase/dehydratase family protein n=1 Tax=Sphingobacterium populi TaxID=1812824 RepID=A0ABW5UGS5_9SPHI